MNKAQVSADTKQLEWKTMGTFCMCGVVFSVFQWMLDWYSFFFGVCLFLVMYLSFLDRCLMGTFCMCGVVISVFDLSHENNVCLVLYADLVVMRLLDYRVKKES